MRPAGRALLRSLRRAAASKETSSSTCHAGSLSTIPAYVAPVSGHEPTTKASLWQPSSGSVSDNQRSAVNSSRTHLPAPDQLWNSGGCYNAVLQQRGFSSSSAPSCSGNDSSDMSSNSSSALQSSMEKLVDTAVNLVEEGKLQQAIEVLQQGVQLLETTFPNSPELSELHNQAALLLLFAHQHEAAAKHATDALDLTQKHFGATHPLTGHRLLRLASIRVAADQLQEAQPLLAAAVDMLSGPQKLGEDPTLSEALFYWNILGLAAADTPTAVTALTPGLQEALKHMVTTLGSESMIVRLALSAHSQRVGRALDQGLPIGEAAFKQHISLQEIQDPNSAELGLTLYQLATTYYSHDMLTDAGPVLQRAAALLRQHYPQDHDLVILCKHRLGMVCAAGRDHTSATLLLGDTWQHYSKQQEGHPLAHEANFGLAMARVKGLDPRLASSDREAKIREELQLMRLALSGMASVLGAEHLLVLGASRYLAQMTVMTGQSTPGNA